MQVQVLPALREWGSLKERARKNGHVRDRNGKLFSSGNGEDAGSNPALTQKKTEEQTRKNGVHRSSKRCLEKTVERRKGAAAMEQIIESERYACVRTGDVEEKM